MGLFLLLPFGGLLLAVVVFFVSKEYLRLTTAVSFLGADSFLGFFWSFGCALLKISGILEGQTLSGGQMLPSLPEPSGLLGFSALFFVAFVLTYTFAYLDRKKATPKKRFRNPTRWEEEQKNWPWK